MLELGTNFIMLSPLFYEFLNSSLNKLEAKSGALGSASDLHNLRAPQDFGWVDLNVAIASCFVLDFFYASAFLANKSRQDLGKHINLEHDSAKA